MMRSTTSVGIAGLGALFKDRIILGAGMVSQEIKVVSTSSKA